LEIEVGTVLGTAVGVNTTEVEGEQLITIKIQEHPKTRSFLTAVSPFDRSSHLYSISNFRFHPSGELSMPRIYGLFLIRNIHAN
jgi:hypothetical protein